MVKENVKNFKESIQKICAENNIDANQIVVVAATKTVDVSTINLLPEYGIFKVGENRTTELCQKYDAVKGLEWHFVGNLQTNKAKYVVGKATLIQSVDRENLAKEIDRLSQKLGIIQHVLIEVNIGEEANKSGVNITKLDSLINYVYTLKNIKLCGFMSVLPINAHNALYLQMNDIFLKYKKADSNIKYLSMGMSGDYITAIKCGANMVRPGSILFGKRNYS